MATTRAKSSASKKRKTSEPSPFAGLDVFEVEKKLHELVGLVIISIL